MTSIFNPTTLYSVAEVAKCLKRSVATIRDWVFHRKMPFCKINGSVCFVGQTLNEWLEDCMVKKDGTAPKGGVKKKKAGKKEKEEFADFVDNLKSKT